MKKCFLLVLSLVFAFASPVLADTLTAHSAITVDGFIIQSINNFNGETFYTDTDLIVGETIRYKRDDTLHEGGLDGADNFNLATVTERNGFRNLAYTTTIFGDTDSYSQFFIFDHNYNERGSIQAIYADGSLGTEIFFDSRNDNPNLWADTGVEDGLEDPGTAWLAVFELSSPAVGIRINCKNLDSLSISAVATPIPGAVWMLGSGLIGLVAIRRRFKK